MNTQCRSIILVVPILNACEWLHLDAIFEALQINASKIQWMDSELVLVQGGWRQSDLDLRIRNVHRCDVEATPCETTHHSTNIAGTYLQSIVP